MDVLLGLVGGLSSIVWGFLFIIFGSYETFKLENSIIGTIFPVSPHPLTGDSGDDENDSKKPESADDAKLAMVNAASASGKYSFNFNEYIFTRALQIIACCKCLKKSAWYKKRVKRIKRHDEAC